MLNKKISTILLSVLMLLVLAFPATAVDTDPTAQMQLTFEKQIESIQSNNMASDSEKVKELAKQYLTMKIQNYKQDSDVDFSKLESKDGKNNHDYMKRKLKLFKELRKNSNAKVLEDEATFNFTDVKVNNGSATVKLYETYKYILDDYEAGYSYRGINYTFNFQKIGDKFFITEVTSDDEFDKEFSKTDFDFDKKLKEMTTPTKLELSAKSLQKEEQLQKAATDIPNESILSNSTTVAPLAADTTLYEVAIDPAKVQAYADTYWSSYNSLFPDYNPNGGDCQNFGSQCIWYGFGGQNNSSSINAKNFPMVGSGTRDWYQTTTKFTFDTNGRWLRVIQFGDYIASSDTTYEGPYGWNNVDNLAYAEVGDLIQMRDSSSYYHTYVVYAVTGTSGSRTNANIWVSAHNSNCNNTRFDTLYGSSQGNCRNVRINKYYTSIPQSPVLENLALNKTVTVTSEYTSDGWGKAKAVDGLRNSTSTSMGWTSYSNTTSEYHTESITIDLGSVNSINKVDLYPRNDTSSRYGMCFPRDFTIQTSTNNSTWATAVTQTNYAQPGNAVQSFTFTPVNARYVKVTGTRFRQDNYGAYLMQLAEVEVYSDNIARKKTVTSSSTYSSDGWNRVNAVDGLRNSTSSSMGWTSYSNVTAEYHTEWITIDLGSTYSVEKVDLYPRNDTSSNYGMCFPRDFTIETSTDNNSWSNAVTQTNYTQPGNAVHSFTFTPRDARYVKITGTRLRQDNNGDYLMQFAEIEVFADE